MVRVAGRGSFGVAEGECEADVRHDRVLSWEKHFRCDTEDKGASVTEIAAHQVAGR